MAAISPEKAQELRLILHDAATQCSERCLYQSAKWYDIPKLAISTSKA